MNKFSYLFISTISALGLAACNSDTKLQSSADSAEIVKQQLAVEASKLAKKDLSIWPTIHYSYYVGNRRCSWS